MKTRQALRAECQMLILIQCKCLLFTLLRTCVFCSFNRVNKSMTHTDMKPIKPWGHVEFRKLHLSRTEVTRRKQSLPQTFTPRGAAVLHTRLFTLFQGCAQALLLSSPPHPPLRHSLPREHPHTHTHAHTSLTIHSLVMGNPLTYRQWSVPEANPIPSKPRHVCLFKTPQRQHATAVFFFNLYDFFFFFALHTLSHANNKNHEMCQKISWLESQLSSSWNFLYICGIRS